MTGYDLSREYAEPLDGVLTHVEIDRHRVVHSAAFRRLQHKTQVFVTGEGDHFRTRLTHTLEVANTARQLAHSLGFSCDLAELVALAHDLGHPPFGHAGERALAACMANHGGFEHNSHTLRVVEYLEHPYPAFRGLNLTRVCRECLAKHTTQYDTPGEHPLRDDTPPPIEGEIVDLADRVTYAMHDLLDGLYADIALTALKTQPLWQSAYDGPDLSSQGWKSFLRPAVDKIQLALIADATQESRARLANDIRKSGALVGLSNEMDRQLSSLQSTLHEGIYRHPKLGEMDQRGQQIVTELFDAFAADPSRLPSRFARRIDEQGVHRVVADYVAGMTDRFCTSEHARICQ